MIDRKQPKIVDKKWWLGESEPMIDPTLNEKPLRLMPRQDVARKEDIEVMNKEVNAEDVTGHKDTG